MIKETVTYVDYNDVERTEEYFFNLNDAEVLELEMSTKGGLTALIDQATKAEDNPTIFRVLKEIIRKGYGVKSLDGKRFMKKKSDGTLYVDEFEDTEAYAVLFMKIVSDSGYFAKFINGMISANAANKLAERNK